MPALKATNQIGILNAIWLQFDGGFWSVVILRILPVVILLAIAALCTFLVWVFARPVLRPDQSRPGLINSIVRISAAVVTAVLVLACLLGAVNAVTGTYPYGEPQQWLTIPLWNNFFLMIVLIWIQTGFAMVILSAALRGIPEETIEAAIIDGANPFQIFFKIKVPQIIGDDRRGLDHDHHRRAEGLRHRLRHDQRPVADAGAGQLHVRQAVPRQRLGRGIGGGHGHHAAGDADPGLERLQRPQGDALMDDGMAGGKSSLTWAVNISVVVLVALWLFPTAGLFISSFRTADQISSSGWWASMFPQEQNQTLRTARPGDETLQR